MKRSDPDKHPSSPKQETIFDSPTSQAITSQRLAFLQSCIGSLRETTEIASALDAGCGVGYMSHFLQSLDLSVVAFDAREENIKEAQRRHPFIQFHALDVESVATQSLGVFDLVLCFGLIYHLENPLLALRNLRACTGKMIIVESMCFPSKLPLSLLRDENVDIDQSLRHVSFYPSEPCIVKMLYQCGFNFVYRMQVLPDHRDFKNTLKRRRARTILSASYQPLEVENFQLVSEPITRDPWLTPYGRLKGLVALTRTAVVNLATQRNQRIASINRDQQRD